MDLLIQNLPINFSHDALEKFISAYAKSFSIEIADTSQEGSWNAAVNIPHNISPLMIIELLDGQTLQGNKLSVTQTSLRNPRECI